MMMGGWQQDGDARQEGRVGVGGGRRRSEG